MIGSAAQVIGLGKERWSSPLGGALGQLPASSTPAPGSTKSPPADMPLPSWPTCVTAPVMALELIFVRHPPMLRGRSALLATARAGCPMPRTGGGECGGEAGGESWWEKGSRMRRGDVAERTGELGGSFTEPTCWRARIASRSDVRGERWSAPRPGTDYGSIETVGWPRHGPYTA
jgi:hypothetical protein